MVGMQRLRNTLALAKASWHVLKADKELVALPIMSAVVTLIVGATFIIPIFLTSGGEEPQLGPVSYVVLFLFYAVTAYITIFFNAALIHGADERMNGGDPTIGSALRMALGDAGHILPWALISATVSIILRSLEERAGLIGRLVIGAIGLAWSLVTFLVLPVLVIERVGVGDAIRRSKDLFLRTWGENVAAQVGFGLLGFIAALPAVAVVLLGVAAGGAAIGVGVAVAVAWMVLVAVVLAALSGIFQTALYHFAATGSVPGGYFDQAALRTAFQPRR